MRSLKADHINNLGLKFQNMTEIIVDGYDITLAVKSFKIPTMTTENVEVSAGNSKVYIAGRTSSGGSTNITLRDFLDANVVKTLVAWRKKVFNEKTGATGRPKDYKTTATIYRYDNTGDVVLDSWIVEGLYPLSLDLGEGNYESGDPVEVALELSYDKCTLSDYDNVAPESINA